MNQAFPAALRLFLLLSGGALVVTLLPPLFGVIVSPSAADAGAAPGVPIMWWAARAMGLLALVALWLSVLFGIFIAGKGAGGLLPKPSVALLHNRWALAAQVATALHVLLVSGVAVFAADAYADTIEDTANVAITSMLAERIPRSLSTESSLTCGTTSLRPMPSVSSARKTNAIENKAIKRGFTQSRSRSRFRWNFKRSNMGLR